MDAKLAQNAIVVVRVKLIVADTGSQYSPFRVYSVHTIRILKNEAHKVFQDLLVRAFRDKPGVPEGECTIYLQKYDFSKKEFTKDNDLGPWFLVGGDATEGVSNVDTGTSK